MNAFRNGLRSAVVASCAFVAGGLAIAGEGATDIGSYRWTGVPCLRFLPDSTFFDDVWSSRDGVTWRPETLDAPWEGRAGLSVVVHDGAIYVLGGSQGDDASTGGTGRVLFNDVWMSRDGRTWTELPATASPPWNGVSPADMRYDVDALVFSGGRAGLPPSIMTFGGDRERFGLPSDVNAFLLESDVGQLAR